MRVDDAAELAGVMASIPGAIAQSRLSGREFTADVLVDRDGRLLTCVPRWRLETKAGISVRGLTFESEEVTQMVAEALAAVGLTGPANVQGFVDADGAAAIVEINPRFSGGLPLTLAAGADVVGAYLEGICRPDVAQRTLSFTPGVQMLRYFAEVFEDAKSGALVADPTGPSAPAPVSAEEQPAIVEEPAGVQQPIGAEEQPALEEPVSVDEPAQPAAVLAVDVIQQRRLQVLQQAASSSNVSETCLAFGVSRSTFYRWKRRAALDGLASPKPEGDNEPLAPVA